jgi:hypothetical protein
MGINAQRSDPVLARAKLGGVDTRNETRTIMARTPQRAAR